MKRKRSSYRQLNKSMARMNFLSLADIVLLEIFSYLSCEDALDAFADLQDFRLVQLLKERGAFYQICLSSQLSIQRYTFLALNIWRFDLVRSFVCKELFSDFFRNFITHQRFPSLTELRLLYVRWPTKTITDFVIAHASTLTHFVLSSSRQWLETAAYSSFLHDVLPHLNRLKLLDTDQKSQVQVSAFKILMKKSSVSDM
jgi:hypothetical protein